MIESRFPPGTRVRIKQSVHLRGRDAQAETVGTVEAWDTQPTGSWYAHSKDGRLPLVRLKLKKPDGELTLLVIDETVQIEAVQAAGA